MNYRFEKLGQPQLKEYVLSEVKELQNLIYTYEKLIQKAPAPNQLLYIKSYLTRLEKSILEYY